VEQILASRHAQQAQGTENDPEWVKSAPGMGENAPFRNSQPRENDTATFVTTNNPTKQFCRTVTRPGHSHLVLECVNRMWLFVY
jgi:hypothetical protein